jgi:hypothetical protein
MGPGGILLRQAFLPGEALIEALINETHLESGAYLVQETRATVFRKSRQSVEAAARGKMPCPASCGE